MPNALKMLHQEHEKVRDEFVSAIGKDDPKEKREFFDGLASDLEIHTVLEEEIFYPKIQAATGRQALVGHSLEDHRRVKRMISELRLLDPSEPDFQLRLIRLRDSVEDHVAEEEDMMFPAAETTLGKKLDDIGSSMVTRKAQLKLAPPITKKIDVDVPIHTAYEKWSHFEDFPKFMEGVEEVRRSDGQMHWRAQIAGKTEEWDAIIDEVEPDTRIAWHSTSGRSQIGTVTFRALSPTKTRVLLEIVYKPEGASETIGAAMGVVSGQLERDLQRFKQAVESQ